MLIPLGILESSGALPGDYELIQTQILTSSQPSITFSNLGNFSTTYKHLQIRLAARSTFSGTLGDSLRLRINSDTGANYVNHGLLGNGSSVSSYASTGQSALFQQRLTSAGMGASSFGAIVIDILDPYATKNKTIRSMGGFADGTPRIELTSGLWLNTSSPTAIELASGNSADFVAGSRFSLYGIRG